MRRSGTASPLRWGLIALGFGLVCTPAHAGKKKKAPLPVEVRVLGEDGGPIPTAVIRHSAEEERHHVNTVTGSWKAHTLYLPTGEMLPFEKGMELQLEISAPGFVSESVRYVIRARKNVIVVALREMNITEETEDADDIMIQFGRDKPRDGATAVDPSRQP